ncbi:MAG: ABC transporter permease [Candidatus Hodarchaeaceae archaeon]|nr:ABC transporter permease [Candidatus Hodarchaeaceae archaeon]
MYKFIAKRLLTIIPILLGVSLATFLLMFGTGDPAARIAGPMAGPEQIESIRIAYGLDKPLYEQYFIWLSKVVRGDLGRSWKWGAPVSQLILERLPRTLELTIAAFMVSLAMGIPLGIIAALRRKTWVDYTGMGIALFGVSIPNFWQGLMAILIFGIWLGWFPIAGYGGIEYLILPAITLGTSQAGSVARLTRSSMLDVLRQDYIRTARAKGLRERAVIYKHALRNAFIPVVTILFLRLPFLFGGTVVIEKVFSWPGMGRLMVDSILGTAPDFLTVLGVMLMFVVLAVVANLLCDITYAYLNPRIRYEERR